MSKSKLKILFILIMFAAINSCAPTSQYNYGVHSFRLYPDGAIEKPLEQIAVLLVKHPLRVVAVDDQKLSAEYIYRAGRTYDILELSAGERMLDVSYKRNSMKMKLKVLAGMVHFIGHDATDELIAPITGRHKWKLRFWGGVLGPQRIQSSDGTLAIYLDKDRNSMQDSYFYVVDGPQGKKRYNIFDIPNNFPVFSTDGSHVAFRYREGDRWFAVFDGRQSTGYDYVESPTFSPDASRTAYFARQGARKFIVLDGDSGPEYEALSDLAFSPDGKKMAYFAKKNEYWQAVIDGIADPPFQQISKLLFSPDSQRTAYKVKTSDFQWALVADGKTGRPYNKIDHVVFSSDSRRLAYRGIKVDSQDLDTDIVHVIVDGQESPAYRIAYEASYNQVLRREFKTYQNLSIPVFSPDGKRVAYSAMRKLMRPKPGETRSSKMEAYFKYAFVVDGQVNGWYDNINLNIAFSPNSQRFGFVAAVRDQECVNNMEGKLSMVLVSRALCDRWNVSLDGEMETPAYIRVIPPIFSPDSQSVAYAIIPHQGFPGWLPVVNGRIIKRMSLNIRGMKFSDDSQKFQYQTLLDREWKSIEYSLSEINKHFTAESVLSSSFMPKLGAPFSETPLPPGKAAVYFYRPSKFVGHLRYSCMVNYSNRFTQVLLRNGGYYKLIADPGEIEIYVFPKQVITLEVEAGQVYYVKGSNAFNVTRVSKVVGAKEIRKCRLAQTN